MTLFRIAPLAIAAATLAGVVSLAGTASTSVPAMAEANAAQTLLQGPQVVGMRRLTEAQYRNTIADIFGSDIRVAGRFEPIVRPAHQLIASGARTRRSRLPGSNRWTAWRAISPGRSSMRHTAPSSCPARPPIRPRPIPNARAAFSRRSGACCSGAR
ncbi:DUF1587 domain-containing protein [Novosphingobium sp. ST904]|uniref:DUF1587 domain-containing protein n=1 Tax=Novosphingobium sp. ST904 TaxID=1684385 RepID=UPI001E4EBA83|nr:DUF1587 domain-containing protein [Novosphingobium sp. ST904]